MYLSILIKTIIIIIIIIIIHILDIIQFLVFLDDIRLHGFVGHFSEGHLLPHTHSVQLFTHLHFYVAHNGQKVSTDSSGSGAYLPWGFRRLRNPPSSVYRPIAHDVTAPVTMHLEDKLAIHA